MPESGGGTVNYLRADGTWDTPPGTGGEDIAGRTILGNNNFGPNPPIALTGTEATTLLDIAATGAKGLCIAAEGVDTLFLASDMNWREPAGTAFVPTVEGPFTLETGEQLDFDHGLDHAPYSIQLFLQCVVANNGFTIGQRYFIPGFYQDSGTFGAAAWADETVLVIQQAANGINLINAGGVVAALSGDWQLWVTYF